MHPRVHAQHTPETPALIVASTGEVVSYAALERRADRGAQALRALGAGEGDAVALMSDNRPEYFDIYWAAQRAGLILVPVSTRLKQDEVAHILRDSGARVLIASPSCAGIARFVAGQGTVRVVALDAIDALPSWGALCDAAPAGPIADESAGGRMVYSSGTTGRPKGIRYAPAGGDPVRPNPGGVLFSRLYGLGPDSVYLSPAPLYHSAPLGFCASVQSLGGAVVMMTKFEPEAFLAAIERHRVTVLMAVPTMFIRLLKLPAAVRARFDLGSLRTVIHAAAPCPIPVKRAMIDWFGPIVEEFYAGSEGNGHVRITSAEWLRKPGSVGRAVVGELHICDDNGHEVPAGENGTVFFGGGGGFSYHNDPGKTAASRNPLHPDWTTMGDVGHLDEDGYLFLSDRKDFMIISGGVNIYPQELENLLVTHPEVADVAVFGVPNEEFGEEVKAVVQPADWSRAGPAFAAELIGWCRERLADVKCPRSIDFEPALPRAETGKLYKNELRSRYLQPA